MAATRSAGVRMRATHSSNCIVSFHTLRKLCVKPALSNLAPHSQVR